MHQIKSITFDLGGVLLNIDIKRTLYYFRNLGVDNNYDQRPFNLKTRFLFLKTNVFFWISC